MKALSRLVLDAAAPTVSLGASGVLLAVALVWYGTSARATRRARLRAAARGARRVRAAEPGRRRRLGPRGRRRREAAGRDAGRARRRRSSCSRARGCTSPPDNRPHACAVFELVAAAVFAARAAAGGGDARAALARTARARARVLGVGVGGARGRARARQARERRFRRARPPRCRVQRARARRRAPRLRRPADGGAAALARARAARGRALAARAGRQRARGVQTVGRRGVAVVARAPGPEEARSSCTSRSASSGSTRCSTSAAARVLGGRAGAVEQLAMDDLAAARRGRLDRERVAQVQRAAARRARRAPRRRRRRRRRPQSPPTTAAARAAARHSPSPSAEALGRVLVRLTMPQPCAAAGADRLAPVLAPSHRRRRSRCSCCSTPTRARARGSAAAWAAVGGLCLGQRCSTRRPTRAAQMYTQRRCGVRVRAAVMSALFDKASRLDVGATGGGSARSSRSSADVQNVLTGVSMAHWCWGRCCSSRSRSRCSPPSPGRQRPPPARRAARRRGRAGRSAHTPQMGARVREFLGARDARLEVFTEMLQGVRVIKMMAAERTFAARCAEQCASAS